MLYMLYAYINLLMICVYVIYIYQFIKKGVVEKADSWNWELAKCCFTLLDPSSPKRACGLCLFPFKRSCPRTRSHTLRLVLQSYWWNEFPQYIMNNT